MNKWLIGIGIVCCIIIFFAIKISLAADGDIARPSWCDPNQYIGYRLVGAQDGLCTGRIYRGQYDLVDSNDGKLRCEYTDLPLGVTAESDGSCDFIPVMAGVYYIKAICYCDSSDPNHCLWPEQRKAVVAVRVSPSKEWKIKFLPFSPLQ